MGASHRLLQDKSSLKTRVTELEVINDLYRGTVNQYEQGGAPQAEMVPQPPESQLKQIIDQVLRREEALKRQVEDKRYENTYELLQDHHFFLLRSSWAVACAYAPSGN